MSDHDQAPPTTPGVDPELVSLTADDLDELAHTLEGAKNIVSGLATLLRQQAAAARARPSIALALVVLGILSAEPCHVDGLLPDRACTPGAVASTSLAIVCRTSTRDRRHVSRDLRRHVFLEYGLAPREQPGAFEVDHLIPLELGGSNALANLWPEAAPGFHDKDRVEDELHARVCSGRMTLEAAQREIAADWTELRR